LFTSKGGVHAQGPPKYAPAKIRTWKCVSKQYLFTPESSNSLGVPRRTNRLESVHHISISQSERCSSRPHAWRDVVAGQ